MTNGTGCFVNNRHHSTGKCDLGAFSGTDATSDIGIGTCVYLCVIIDIDALILMLFTGSDTSEMLVRY